MELWIRSQDKRFIVKITNGIYINKCYKNGHTNGYEITCGYGGELGIYSEKKALEILDEIQETKLGNFHYKCPSNVKVSTKEDTIVYQMPEE